MKKISTKNFLKHAGYLSLPEDLKEYVNNSADKIADEVYVYYQEMHVPGEQAYQPGDSEIIDKVNFTDPYTGKEESIEIMVANKPWEPGNAEWNPYASKYSTLKGAVVLYPKNIIKRDKSWSQVKSDIKEILEHELIHVIDPIDYTEKETQDVIQEYGENKAGELPDNVYYNLHKEFRAFFYNVASSIFNYINTKLDSEKLRSIAEDEERSVESVQKEIVHDLRRNLRKSIDLLKQGEPESAVLGITPVDNYGHYRRLIQAWFKFSTEERKRDFAKKFYYVLQKALDTLDEIESAV